MVGITARALLSKRSCDHKRNSGEQVGVSFNPLRAQLKVRVIPIMACIQLMVNETTRERQGNPNFIYDRLAA